VLLSLGREELCTKVATVDGCSAEKHTKLNKGRVLFQGLQSVRRQKVIFPSFVFLFPFALNS
jgi:hypothetical protein